MNNYSLYIDGLWVEGEGSLLSSKNPATEDVVWQGKTASTNDVENAVTAARKAFQEWQITSLESRIQYLYKFRELVESNKEDLAKTISIENGKPLWEATQEIAGIIGKVALSVESYSTRCQERIIDFNERRAVVHHRPHGIIAIFGPFNFPGHLPHGHIIPALLAGNTVIFKPSELTPWIAEKLSKIWEKVELPKGVFNLLQGGPETGQALANHPHVDGLFFTGSWSTGQKLEELYAKKWGKILALEMGGNNPIIYTEVNDIDKAVEVAVQSAFLTSGQRCSCARRLIILNDQSGEMFLEKLKKTMREIKVGPWTASPEPFMGPLISSNAADKLLEAQTTLIKKGGQVLVKIQKVQGASALLSPGLTDVTNVTDRQDEEHFGPLLQLIRVDTFEEALSEASNTDYGLTAGLLSDNRQQFEQFSQSIRAGILCWNVPTTNASSALPFGGLGKSGNFRPSAYYAADYCAYPVSFIEPISTASD